MRKLKQLRRNKPILQGW